MPVKQSSGTDLEGLSFENGEHFRSRLPDVCNSLSLLNTAFTIVQYWMLLASCLISSLCFLWHTTCTSSQVLEGLICITTWRKEDNRRGRCTPFWGTHIFQMRYLWFWYPVASVFSYCRHFTYATCSQALVSLTFHLVCTTQEHVSHSFKSGGTNPGGQVAVATKFCTLEGNSCGSWAWNLPLAQRILKCLLDFWKT